MAASSVTAPVSVVIGAALAGTFESVFAKAGNSVGRIGDAIRKLDAQSQQYTAFEAAQTKAGESVKELEARLASQTQALSRAEQRIVSLREKIASTGDPTGKFAVRLDSAEQAAERARTAIAATDGTLVNARSDFDAASASAAKYAQENQKVAGTLGVMQPRWDAYQRMQEKVSAGEAKLSKYRHGLFGMWAAGALIRKTVMAAAESEAGRFQLGMALKTQGFGPDALNASVAAAKEHARSHIPTVQQQLDVELSLNRTGLDAQTARLAAGFVADFASVTEQDFKSAGVTIGAAYNELSGRMQGTAEQKLKRIADVFARARFRFNLEGLDAESTKKIMAASVRANLPLERTVALMGELSKSGWDAGSSSAALTGIVNKLTSASQQLGFQVIRDSQGNLDMAATLRSLRGAVAKHFGSLERGRDAITKAFGPRAVDALTILFNKTEQLRQSEEDLARNSAGTVADAEKKKREEAAGTLEMLRKNIKSILSPLGAALLPGFKTVLTPIAMLGTALAELASRHKGLTTVIGTTMAIALTLGAAFYVVGYASTYCKLTVDRLALGIEKMGIKALAGRLGLLSLGTAAPAAAAGMDTAGVAAGVASAGFWSLTASMWPVIAAVAAVAVVGLLIWKFWKPLKAFFGGFWEGFVQALAPVGGALRSAFAPLKPVWDWLRAAFSWLFTQTGLTSEGFAKCFASGIWWGQKIGAVLGVVFTTIGVAIGTVIQSIVFLAKSIGNLASVKPR